MGHDISHIFIKPVTQHVFDAEKLIVFDKCYIAQLSEKDINNICIKEHKILMKTGSYILNNTL
ncbi:MAG: hypothetical protein QS748_00925 [Candidatus Endonucleobacter bathymodioli]|uniref:Uncharacterized protein n=1 Tax=Candidatus Endonucleibacter bathymodioli TaxID=539814 RepID=A0AA90SWL5_9GAMM|nr:hypothetical protein [Candidatus Endonucleobacter bathymodioli]